MPTPQTTELKRALGFPLLLLYGLGTVLGAGIYVLIGEVAGRAGSLAPLSFLGASLLSALTAFGFAELAGRFPRSAGEAVYVFEGFGRPALSLGVGLLVAAAGIVSAAAITQGFAGYLQQFVALPEIAAVTALILVLTGLAVWGITESVAVAALVTLIEGGALLVVIVLGALAAEPAAESFAASAASASPAWGVLSGAVLAFYAFIGFEDMVNVAEEVHDAPRTMGRAIFAVVGISSALYAGIAYVAVRVVPPAELAASRAPLALIFERVSGWPPEVMSAIAMLAVVNGGLIQIIMAARVLYGLSRQGALPAWLGRVSPTTRTPIFATALAGVSVLGAALLLPLATLAEVTSTLILIVFTVVNAALLRVKRQGPAPEGTWVVPGWVPLLGMLSSATFFVVALREVFLA